MQYANNAVDILSARSVSNFAPGISNVDTSLFYPWGDNNPQAIRRVKTLLKAGLSFINQPIMGWGADDPWPDPSQPEPSNWNTLDQKMQIALDTGNTPVITLCEAPWWMKGELQQDGSTKMLTRDDEFTAISTTSRILDNKMDDWLHLVRRVAERYMVAPYNVRYFQVWNELKGYYNPETNDWDMSVSPGDPDGNHAEHGYTYMYNEVYTLLKDVARELDIDPIDIQIGGPYTVMKTWSGVSNQSSPSNITRAYGNYDQRDLNALMYWLQHKVGAEFITIDGNNGNHDGTDISDPFTAAEKFADVVHWLRNLDHKTYPGGSTLPIWWAEWYATTGANQAATRKMATAVKTYAMIKLIKAGGAVALAWGGAGEGETGDDRGLWTPTDENGGGQALPWYTIYKTFNTDFGPGTMIYKTHSPSSVEALVSSTKTMLVNKTGHSLTLNFQGNTIKLAPYQVQVIDTIMGGKEMNLSLPGVISLVLMVAGLLLFIRKPWQLLLPPRKQSMH
jgi:hypothetical protein